MPVNFLWNYVLMGVSTIFEDIRVLSVVTRAWGLSISVQSTDYEQSFCDYSNVTESDPILCSNKTFGQNISCDLLSKYFPSV